MKKKLLALLAVLGLTIGIAASPAYAVTTYYDHSLYTVNGQTLSAGASMAIYGGFQWDFSYSGSGWNSNPGSYCDAQVSIHNTTNGYYKLVDVNTDIISSPNMYEQTVPSIGWSNWTFTMTLTGWNCYLHDKVFVY